MAAGYTIESVTDLLAPDGKGSFTTFVVVTYTIPEGYRGTVKLPKDTATVDVVRKAVDVDAAKYKAIYAL